jgi:hypothetical protein
VYGNNKPVTVQVIGSSSLHLWLVNLRITEIEQKPQWLQDWGPYRSSRSWMDLSGPGRIHHALGEKILSTEKGNNYSLQWNTQNKSTLTKDSNRTLNIEKKGFKKYFPCIVLAWRNLALRFHMTFWVSPSLFGHFKTFLITLHISNISLIAFSWNGKRHSHLVYMK